MHHQKNQPKYVVMEQSVCAITDDRPYEERTRQERMNSEMRQTNDSDTKKQIKNK